uniref:Manganese-dependent adp-ribose cdp-alcohol diphosphatase n=1 Tax=Tetraselmis sp. GSL018 TaxID=582737 RepID=A0A061RWB5_9CHLO|mmetsp:Transcript_13523/g.32022  ORF Transcript_13523/g.32022 Transcript_13523/m.32022 type:complete len:231 (-) Transcript_13523:183-875(-)
MLQGLIRQDFERVAAAFDELGHIPVYHVVGNHCLECPREDVVSRLPALRQQEHCYYSVRIVEGWRLIVLDTSELSFHSGYGKDSDIWRESQLFYEQHPPSEHPQMAEWNGGIGARQMRWLEQALAGAAAAGDCVIVAAHHPIGSAQKCLRAWNWEEIHETLARWSSCVRLVLTGHDHLGGYGALAGIHYVTLEGVVESADDSNSYAVIEVREDAIEIHGRGVVSRVLPIG